MSDTSNGIKQLIPKKKSYQIVFYVGIGLLVLSIVLLIVDYADFGYWRFDNIFEHFFSFFFWAAYGYAFILGVVAIIISIVLDKEGNRTGTNKVSKDDSADIESLMRLKELLDSGVITQEEFDVKKGKLLK